MVERQRGRVLLATLVRALVVPGMVQQYCMYGAHYITHTSRVCAVPYRMSFCCAVRGKPARLWTSRAGGLKTKCLATMTSADCFYDVTRAQT